jgi:exodeoxyribonuclease V gamma subunit
LQIHGAHSPQREIQILHDRLLTLFAKLPGLEPRDIIVMAPDIDAYAPYVDAVFRTASPEQHIPWSIADRSASADQPLLAAIELLLGLPRSRLEATAVLSLLQVPALRRRFGIDEDGLARITTWITKSGIRWGLDEHTRTGLGLPAVRDNTWAFGLERLFLGYTMPADADQDSYKDVLPYIDIEGAEVEYLGALQALIDELGTWRRRLQDALPPAAWLREIKALIGDFFAVDEDESDAVTALSTCMDALFTQCETAAVDEPLSFDLVADRLRQTLDESRGPQHFLSGRVTFCNMVPMRSIPFRVLCLIGMNGSDFPRSQRPLSFDRIAQAPRRGDRSRRRDDRYLFLEALLSARDALHISWISNDARDNSERVPSVVVDELLDYVGTAYRLDGDGKLLDHLLVRHPLQPFSRRYFDGKDPRLVNHSKRWLAAAQVEPAPEIPPFAPTPLDVPDEALCTLDVADLIAFLRDPAEHFLCNRLRMRLPRAEDLIEDDEPFAIDFLQRYWLRDSLIAERAAGRTPEDSLTRLRAAGSLPHGAVGEIVVDAQSGVVESIVSRRALFEGSPVDPVEVDLPIGEFQLQGQLRDLAGTGRGSATPSRCVVRMAWCGRDPIGRDFEQYATRILAPLIEHSEDIKAGEEVT